MAKKIFKISGMHCTSCAMNIEWDLEDQGLTAKCDYAKQTLEVEIDADDKAKLVQTTIEKLGYKIEP